jgi:hypothetical protein
MTVRQLLAISAFLFPLTQLCQAGPCTKEIEAMQARSDAGVGTMAAAGPSAKQSVGAQLHRQPTRSSMASVERQLGQLSPDTIVKVNAAMDRAQKADAAGDETECRKALDEVARIFVAEPAVK